MTRTQPHRPTRTALSLLAAALALLAFAPTSQAKVVVDSFGFVGSEGGHLNNPAGIAINQTGAGGVAPGTIYVTEGLEGGEGTASNRIQRLDPEGHFERLWGFNTVGPNELQMLTITFGANGEVLRNSAAGYFTLTFGGDTAELEVEGSGPLGSNLRPFRAELQSGLEALPSIGAGNVAVRGSLSTGQAGGSFEIEFTGARGGTDLEQLHLDASHIQGPSPITASVSTLQNGSGGPFAGFEICTVAAECKRGEASRATGDGGEIGTSQGIAVNQSTGDVYAIDWTNHRIDEFDANGNFLRAFGRDVVSTGGTGDFGTNAYEVCTVAADCKDGLANAEAGAITIGRDIAIDSAGNVWLAAGNNHRLEQFGEDGHFIAAYGWDVDALGGSGGLEKCTSTAVGACQAGTVGAELGQFGGFDFGPNPQHLTVDAAGFLYALDDGNNRIQRFDPAGPSAALFAPNLAAETGLSGVASAAEGIQALPDGHFLLAVHAQGGARLLDLDSSGHLTEASLAGDGVPRLQHLALDQSSGAIYAAVQNTFGAIPIGPGVVIIDDGPTTRPTVTIDQPTSIGGEDATFNASVDPLGVPVAGCKFQYSTDQVAWKDVPEPDCGSLDLEGGPQQVSEPASGLEPATHYYVRFVAGRYYSAAATVVSGEEEFTTISLPPIVSDVGAAQVTDASAYLAGEVKPRSQSFEYHFEYGTTPALGSSTPTVELSGSKQTIVSRQIEGLQPDTIYYLQLIAQNVAGTTESEPTSTFRTRPSEPAPGPCPNQALRTEQRSTFLPDCRAYEQVSPPGKNFADAGAAFNAADGEAALFTAPTGFGDPPGQIAEIFTAYRAARTASGWRTRWFSEPYCTNDLQRRGSEEPPAGSGLSGFSANLDFAVITHPESASCPYPPLDPAAPLPQSNLYLADYRADPLGFDLLTPQPAFDLRLKEQGGVYAAAGADWTHVIYTSTGRQTPNAPAGKFLKVFDWHEGTLKLVSINPAGNPFAASSVVPDDAVNGVSAEGNRIFFMSPTNDFGQLLGETELYMRQNGTKTFDVSRSECTSSCGEGATDTFLAATPNGAKVAFISKAKLTDDDTLGNGSDLYLYTHSANPPVDKNLTLLSKDEEPADGSVPQVLGLLGISEDAETVYFVAEGQLVPGAPTAAGPKVYRWQANGASPTLDYLGTLKSEDASNWTGSGLNGSRGAVREVTPDGKYLLIHTAARLDPGADHDSTVDVYRWSEADGWLCISCQAPSSPSAGDSTFIPDALRFNQRANAISDDGGRVFFTSSDALLPADTNERQDVYEWHQDGTLSLISSGTDSNDSAFIGADTTGRDVFFMTRERLVGWDTDNNVDVYDARLEGGFPERLPTGVPCEGEACRAAPTAAPPPLGAGSAAFEGPGNQTPEHHCKKGFLKRHGKCVKQKKRRHCKKGFLKRHGKCVKQKKRRHKRAHQRAANNHRRAAR